MRRRWAARLAWLALAGYATLALMIATHAQQEVGRVRAQVAGLVRQLDERDALVIRLRAEVQRLTLAVERGRRGG